MTKRYETTFANLKANQQGGFVPFVTLCDPNYERSIEIIHCLINNGADALELGLPFSDPIADGPVIQKASIRALESGSSVHRCFELIEKIREEFENIPIGLLVYSNLVVSNGINQFYELAAIAGVDSVLIADVPLIESEPFIQAATKNNIRPIFIATPNASPATLKKIAELSKGYVYLLSRAGVTGTETKAEMPVERILASLKQHNAPPSLLGFGISKSEQVREAIQLGADGVISGSAVVKIIESNLQAPEELLRKLAEFVKEMKMATME